MADTHSKGPRRSKDFDTLEQQYRTQGNWAELANLYKDSAQEQADRKITVVRLVQAGTIFRDKMLDQDRAVGCFREAENVLNGWIAATSEPVGKSDLLCDLAKVYLEVLKNREKAIECYVKAFELDPQKTHLMVVLGDIYAHRENWGEAISRIESEAKHTSDPAMKAKYLGEIADMYSFILSDPAQAIEVYQKVLRLDPSNKKAVSTLENLLIKGRRWSDLVSFYRELRALTTDSDEIVSILTKLGLIFRDKLKEPMRAVSVYEEILAIQPKNFRVSTKLEEMVSSRELWEASLQTLEESLRTTTGALRTPFLAMQGEMLERFLGRPEEASRKLEEALRLDPTHEGALSLAKHIWEKTKDYDRIARTLEHAAKQTQNLPRKRSLLRELAEVAEKHLLDPIRTMEALETLVEVEPGDDVSRKRLIALYENQRMWPRMEALLERISKSSTQEEAAQSILRLAQLQETQLLQTRKAIESYERIKDHPRLGSVALGALERLYPVERRWPELVSVYDKLAEAEPDLQKRGKIYFQQARILEEKLGELATAAAIYEKVLPMTEDPLPLMGRVEQIYFSEKRWDDLAKLYDSVLARLVGGPDEIRILFKLAELTDQKLSQADRSRQYLELILQKNSKDLLALRMLERLSTEKQDWEGLILIYRKQFEASEEPTEKVSVYLKAGDLFLRQLKDEKRAEECYRRVLTFDSTNLVALDFLSDFYRRSGRTHELVNILTARIKAVKESKPLAELHFELARIIENLNPDSEDAISHYETALNFDPSLKAARTALTLVFERAKRPDDIVRMLESELEHERDRLEGSTLAEKIARLYEEKLGKPEKAIESYRKSLDLRSASPAVLQRLIHLLEAAGRPIEALPQYETLLSLELNPSERAKLCIRIGEIHEKDRKDRDLAAKFYEQALELDAEAPGLLARLRSLYEETNQQEGLLGIYERLLPSLPKDEAAQLHFRMGEIFEQHVQAPDRAMLAYQIASELDPGFVSPLEAMRRLLKSEVNWGEYIKVTSSLAELTGSPAARADLLMESARLWRDQFLQNDRAIASFEEAIALKPDAKALNELSLLYLDRKDHASALRVAKAALELGKDEGSRLSLLERIGTIEFEVNQNAAEAADAFREMLSIQPKNLGAIRSLAEISRRRGDGKAQLSALQMLLEADESSEGKIGALLQMAELWRGPLGSPENASQALRALLQIDPTHVQALTLLSEVTEDAAEWSKLAGQILKELQKAKQKDLFVAASISIANVEQQKFKKVDGSIATIERALKETGDRPDLLEALLPLLKAKGDSLTMADIIARRARLYSTPAEKALALLSVSDLWVKSLDNPGKAISALEEAQSLDPHSEVITERLLDLYEITKNPAAAEVLLKRILENKDRTSPRMRALALRQIRLLRLELGRSDEAMGLLEALVVEAPDDLKILQEAASMYETSSSSEKLSIVLSQIADLLHGPSMIEVRQKLAALAEKKLQNPKLAIEQYELILRSSPRNLETLSQLERLFEQLKDDQGLIGVLQDRIPLLENPKEAAQLHSKLGTIYRNRLKDETSAIENFERSLTLDPSQDDVAKILLSIYEKTSRYQELTDVWRRRAPLLAKSQAISVYESLANIWQNNLKNPIQSLEFLDSILKLEPHHQNALTRMAEIHERNENHRALAWTLRRLAESFGKAPEAVELWLKLGRLQAGALGSHAEAIETFKKVLALDPSQTEALSSLQDLFGKDKRWPELADVLRTLASSRKTTASASILKELFRVQLDRMKEPGAAIQTMEELLLLKPDDQEGLHFLEELYKGSGQFEPLASTYERELSLDIPDSRRMEILRLLGTLYDERVNLPMKAIATFEEVIQKVPEDLQALSRLEGLYRKQGRTQEALQILERRAYVLPTGAERTALLESLASEATTTGRVDDALRNLKKLAEDPREKRLALQRMAELFEQSGDPTPLAEVLGQLIEVTPEPALQVPILLSLGRLHHLRLGQSLEAERFLRRVLEISPHQEEAVELMKLLYRQTENWTPLARFLESELKTQKDPRKRIPLIRELADLHRGPLNEPGKAVHLYQALLELSPHELNALSVLAHIYFERGQWKEAAPLYDRLVKITTSKKEPARAARLFFELGTVMRHLEKTDEALVHFNQALTYEPDNIESVRALSELYFELGQWPNALRTLQKVIQLGRTEDAAYVDQQYYRLLQTLERLKKGDEALALYEQATERLDRHAGALKLVASLYHRMGRDAEAKLCFEKTLEMAQSATDRHPALLALADIALRTEGNEIRAKELLSELLDHDPSDKPALELYLRICERQAEWPDVLRTCEQLAQVETEPSKLADLFFRLGTLHDEQTGDIKKAQQFYMKAVEAGDGHIPAMIALEKLCENDEDWKRLAAVYDKAAVKLRNQGDLRRAANFLVALGLLQLAKLRDSLVGMQTLREAIRLDPTNRGARKELARRLASDPMGISEATTLYHDLLKQTPTDADALREVATFYLRVGKVIRASVLRSILVSLGEATPEEVRFVSEHSIPSHMIGRKSPPNIHHLLPKESTSPVALTMACVGEKLVPSFATGAKTNSLLSASDVVPQETREAISELAPWIGLEAKQIRLFYSSSIPTAELEFTSPASIGVGPGLFKLSKGAQRLILSYHLATLRLGHRLFLRLPLSEAEDLLEALFSVAHERNARREGSQTYAPVIRKALSKRDLKEVSEILRDPAGTPSGSLDSVLHFLRVTSLRVAITLSEDILGATEAISWIDSSLKDDLLAFLSSEAFLSFRENRSAS